MTKWEHRVEDLPEDNESLRLIGHTGWEAVAVWTTPSGEVKVLFKRPVSQENS